MTCMDSGVGHLVEPDKQIPVCLLDRVEPVAAPEALVNVVDGKFHLGLHPGREDLGRKAEVLGEVLQVDVGFHLHVCQSALKIDPLSAFNFDPPPRIEVFS